MFYPSGSWYFDSVILQNLWDPGQSIVFPQINSDCPYKHRLLWHIQDLSQRADNKPMPSVLSLNCIGPAPQNPNPAGIFRHRPSEVVLACGKLWRYRALSMWSNRKRGPSVQSLTVYSRKVFEAIRAEEKRGWAYLWFWVCLGCYWELRRVAWANDHLCPGNFA